MPTTVAAQERSMVVKLHALTEHPPEVRPARAKRQWMDDFSDRHAYRCLPLSIANASGWEVLCPIPVEIRWNGGMAKEDINVIGLKELPDGAPVEHFCRSNFSRGIITVHLDYVIETEPDWGILATGPVNDPKEGATPLTGIIESDWLPYPFTMNWQLTRPGITRFEEGEPFCFFLPVPLRVLPSTELQIHRLADDPELQARHNQFRDTRNEFMGRINAGDQGAIKEAWQRHYFVGRHPDGVLAPEHLNKLRLKEPVDVRPPRPSETAAAEQPAIQSNAAEPPNNDARWAADSPLNGVATYSGAVAIPNRARMDGEGRFTPGPDTGRGMETSPSFFMDCPVKPQLLRFGESQSPVVVIDGFSGAVGDIAGLADQLAPFPPIKDNYYPGVRRAISEADTDAYAYVLETCRQAAPFIGGAFEVQGFDLVEGSFSLVTLQPDELEPVQRAPHFDSPDPLLFALLHYLRVPAGSGTAFYRHRATGVERVTEQNLARFVPAAQAEAARLPRNSGYMHGSDPFYEQIGAVEAVPDRVIIYHSSLLHSGIIPPNMTFSADPRQGRLTANFFLRGR